VRGAQGASRRGILRQVVVELSAFSIITRRCNNSVHVESQFGTSNAAQAEKEKARFSTKRAFVE
jgi:hypothetical protein